MNICGTSFCMETKKKRKIKTYPNKKFHSSFNGQNNT